MNYLYTVGGYAAIFGLSYAAWRVSSQQQARKRALARGAKSSQQDTKKEDSKKKQRQAAFVQEAQESASKAASVPQPEAPAPVPDVKDTMDDSKANREFALQLAKAKEGTKFDKKADGKKQREKSVKQSKANQLGSAPKASEDEDEPIVGSEPEEISGDVPEDTNANIPAEAGRVDDMLEKKPEGPSVLRITGDAPKKEQKKATKAPEKVETKKQRQAKKKAAANKAAVEEAEAQRKVLEEKQRRTARIADGRAAKDGSQFTNAAVNAWNESKTNSTPVTTNGFHQPLDTFETSEVPAPAPAAVAPKAAPQAAPKPAAPEPVAENNEDEWNTVTTKASKRKAAAASAPAAAAAAAPEEPAKPRAAPAPAPAAPAVKKAAPAANNAFSALSNDDEEEQEEEWDV